MWIADKYVLLSGEEDEEVEVEGYYALYEIEKNVIILLFREFGWKFY